MKGGDYLAIFSPPFISISFVVHDWQEEEKQTRNQEVKKL